MSWVFIGFLLSVLAGCALFPFAVLMIVLKVVNKDDFQQALDDDEYRNRVFAWLDTNPTVAGLVVLMGAVVSIILFSSIYWIFS